ncbi:glycosyltransferase [uncultured Flavobacterium sp.]|uniref:glycosyltransferase n=1 Tax=uncultured Flavobacterium sp. TaxID=165435 RepID=UPI0025F9D659|nr:glycosyltransferase [uncultured Flavobacterium sp.]
MNRKQKILIIGSVWPEPNSSAAGSRMLQLLQLFLANNWDVAFSSSALVGDYSFDIESLGVSKYSIVLNSDSFDILLQELNPDIVLFDRFMTEEQFGWRVANICPNALRILDTEDLHFLRQARHQAFKEKREFDESYLFSDTAKREVASILRCDLSLIIAEFEMDLLIKSFKIDKLLLHYLPILSDKIDINFFDSLPSFNDRNDFIFIGNFWHEPNWNAVQYLKESIWPLLSKKLPKARLLVYGAYPSQKVFQLHNEKERFYVLGRAENAYEVIKKAKVMLAPIRFGAGIKGKLLDAMHCGTPSVTTSIGAESMFGELPWNGFIADSVADFVEKATKLYSDENIWLEAQNKGRNIINDRYDRNLFEEDFIQQILQIQNTLEIHRQQNFIGSILQHNIMNATKYMSKWIQEKNK